MNDSKSHDKIELEYSDCLSHQDTVYCIIAS